ncbi:short-chain dehydrogenase [Penicillium majusculum]|nr:short-chain dehydrogenase [Penicillium majusculum]
MSNFLGELGLTGATIVYLGAKGLEYLNGRHLSASWDIQELETLQSGTSESDVLMVGQFA